LHVKKETIAKIPIKIPGTSLKHRTTYTISIQEFVEKSCKNLPYL